MKLTDFEAPNGAVHVRSEAIDSITPIYNGKEIIGSIVIVGGIAHRVTDHPEDINAEAELSEPEEEGKTDAAPVPAVRKPLRTRKHKTPA